MLSTTLFKTTLLISLLGTFSLLIISEFSEVNLSTISEATKAKQDSKVKVRGEIISIHETPRLYILKITDNTAIISIVIFKEETLNLKKGLNIETTGTLTEYKRIKEILADEIRII